MSKSPQSRFQFSKIAKHSQGLVREAKEKCSERRRAATETISFIGFIFETVEQQPKSLFKNVRQMLIARFLNHLYSMFILVERGLFIDAYSCARSATETTAFYWAICVDHEFAENYDRSRSPQPVDVRKKLEAHGIDISEIKDVYRHQSEVVHVGNKSDQLQVRWDDPINGQISVGGGSDPELQRSAFNAIVAMMVIFLRYDPDFEPVEKPE